MKQKNRETMIEEKVAHLSQVVADLQSRLGMTDGEGDGNGHDRSSRRDLLKLAGAAAVGAAGGMVFRAVPAAAATGGTFMLGQANTENTASILEPDIVTTPVVVPPMILALEGAANLTVPAGGENDSTGAQRPTPVLLVVAADSTFPNNGATPPVPVLPGHAAIQSVAGRVTFVDNSTTPPTTFFVAEAIKGFATQPAPTGGQTPLSTGVVGEGDDYGVAGFGSIDVAALGSGFMLQSSIVDNSGNPTAGPPANAVATTQLFIQARDMNGVLWLTNPDGSWRRVNSSIPIAPFRLYDSRTVGGARPANSITTITVAPHPNPSNASQPIPANATGVFGNLTVVNPSANGFVAIFPAGQAVPGVSTVNYTAHVSALSNHFACALGTGGAVSVFVSGNGPTNFIVDVQGYII